MMRRPLVVAAASIAFLFLLAVGTAARAAEIKVLVSSGMKMVMEDLGPKFERATGHTLVMSFPTTEAIVKRVRDGEAADLVIALPAGIERLVAAGKTVAGGATVVARSGIGVAVRKGASKPDISSPEALKRALLAARSIAYSNRGVSGSHFDKVLDTLGITDEMRPKSVFPRSGPVGGLVADGEAEIAVQQIPELVQVDGIDLVGPLPADLQATFVYAAAVMTGARDAAAAMALIDFLHAPDAAAVIRAKGFEPAPF